MQPSALLFRPTAVGTTPAWRKCEPSSACRLCLGFAAGPGSGCTGATFPCPFPSPARGLSVDSKAMVGFKGRLSFKKQYMPAGSPQNGVLKVCDSQRRARPICCLAATMFTQEKPAGDVAEGLLKWFHIPGSSRAEKHTRAAFIHLWGQRQYDIM
ncbi:hypothetical protein RRG08_067326 [Elysia crispata]|uniref:Uncharacterized protein n=1 Tax=Elysia crispata TaxID=231223 RepID=A0AAE1CWI3_9GAST|nr:hypothetical protein RRG08_067326 [Elysia crispata]